MISIMENRKTVLVANQFEGIERSGELLVDNVFTLKYIAC